MNPSDGSGSFKSLKGPSLPNASSNSDHRTRDECSENYNMDEFDFEELQPETSKGTSIKLAALSSQVNDVLVSVEEHNVELNSSRSTAPSESVTSPHGQFRVIVESHSYQDVLEAADDMKKSLHDEVAPLVSNNIISPMSMHWRQEMFSQKTPRDESHHDGDEDLEVFHIKTPVNKDTKINTNIISKIQLSSDTNFSESSSDDEEPVLRPMSSKEVSEKRTAIKSPSLIIIKSSKLNDEPISAIDSLISEFGQETEAPSGLSDSRLSSTIYTEAVNDLHVDSNVMHQSSKVMSPFAESFVKAVSEKATPTCEDDYDFDFETISKPSSSKHTKPATNKSAINALEEGEANIFESVQHIPSASPNPERLSSKTTEDLRIEPKLEQAGVVRVETTIGSPANIVGTSPVVSANDTKDVLGVNDKTQFTESFVKALSEKATPTCEDNYDFDFETISKPSSSKHNKPATNKSAINALDGGATDFNFGEIMVSEGLDLSVFGNVSNNEDAGISFEPVISSCHNKPALLTENKTIDVNAKPSEPEDLSTNRIPHIPYTDLTTVPNFQTSHSDTTISIVDKITIQHQSSQNAKESSKSLPSSDDFEENYKDETFDEVDNENNTFHDDTLNGTDSSDKCDEIAIADRLDELTTTDKFDEKREVEIRKTSLSLQPVHSLVNPERTEDEDEAKHSEDESEYSEFAEDEPENGSESCHGPSVIIVDYEATDYSAPESINKFPLRQPLRVYTRPTGTSVNKESINKVSSPLSNPYVPAQRATNRASAGEIPFRMTGRQSKNFKKGLASNAIKTGSSTAVNSISHEDESIRFQWEMDASIAVNGYAEKVLNEWKCKEATSPVKVANLSVVTSDPGSPGSIFSALSKPSKKLVQINVSDKLVSPIKPPSDASLIQSQETEINSKPQPSESQTSLEVLEDSKVPVHDSCTDGVQSLFSNDIRDINDDSLPLNEPTDTPQVELSSSENIQRGIPELPETEINDYKASNDTDNHCIIPSSGVTAHEEDEYSMETYETDSLEATHALTESNGLPILIPPIAPPVKLSSTMPLRVYATNEEDSKVRTARTNTHNQFQQQLAIKAKNPLNEVKHPTRKQNNLFSKSKRAGDNCDSDIVLKRPVSKPLPPLELESIPKEAFKSVDGLKKALLSSADMSFLSEALGDDDDIIVPPITMKRKTVSRSKANYSRKSTPKKDRDFEFMSREEEIVSAYLCIYKKHGYASKIQPFVKKFTSEHYLKRLVSNESSLISSTSHTSIDYKKHPLGDVFPHPAPALDKSLDLPPITKPVQKSSKNSTILKKKIVLSSDRVGSASSASRESFDEKYDNIKTSTRPELNESSYVSSHIGKRDLSIFVDEIFAKSNPVIAKKAIEILSTDPYKYNSSTTLKRNYK